MAIIGVIFTLVSSSILTILIQKARRQKEAREHGTAIKAKIIAVELETSARINSRRPFIIRCQWLNPTDNKLYVFISDYIWFDPTPFIKGEYITVKIMPQHPTAYWVDISFLPSEAEM